MKNLVWIGALALLPAVRAQTPDNVLIVVNDNSALSREAGEYYARMRGVPMRNLCRIRTATGESASRDQYNREIAAPVARYLRENKLAESILYIVTTAGVPLLVTGHVSGMTTDTASVDSELALLYTDMHTGRPHAVNGPVPNPFFGK